MCIRDRSSVNQTIMFIDLSVLNVRCFVAILLDSGDEDNKDGSVSAENMNNQDTKYEPAYRHSPKTLSDFNIIISEYRGHSPSHNDSGDHWILPSDIKVLPTSRPKEETGSKENIAGSVVSLCYVLDSQVTSANIKKDGVKYENREAPFQGLLSGWRNAVSSIAKRT